MLWELDHVVNTKISEDVVPDDENQVVDPIKEDI